MAAARCDFLFYGTMYKCAYILTYYYYYYDNNIILCICMCIYVCDHVSDMPTWRQNFIFRVSVRFRNRNFCRWLLHSWHVMSPRWLATSVLLSWNKADKIMSPRVCVAKILGIVIDVSIAVYFRSENALSWLWPDWRVPVCCKDEWPALEMETASHACCVCIDHNCCFLYIYIFIRDKSHSTYYKSRNREKFCNK